MGGIEYVDVDGDVHRATVEALTHALDDAGDAVDLVVVTADHLEAEDAVVFEVLLAVERSTDADVLRTLHVDQALFAGAAEGGAVGERLTEVGVPGVEVSVEVQDGDRAVIAGQ